MEGLTILAPIPVIPVILFPAAFVWYMTVGGIVQTARAARAVKAVRIQAAEVTK